ncbi:unnamed protein product [Schistocephalus solidus]|uniref:Rab-GAP TBC domain-containing protein n=1 Tax=Schistocephalus solidus TaxID=70667 RepID=A0A183TJH1_SCHSO|nr:unnamed protein product [Schistocephalus solidus]
MLNYAFDTSTDIRQIDLDINRTFRSTTFFREAFGPRQQALFNILSAYSVYNSEVGYCQLIVGFKSNRARHPPTPPPRLSPPSLSCPSPPPLHHHHHHHHLSSSSPPPPHRLPLPFLPPLCSASSPHLLFLPSVPLFPPPNLLSRLSLLLSGMSDMAGMLLIYIADDEEAFWALAQLLNGPKHKMHSLFVRDFPGLTRFFKHHEKVLQVLLPAVYKHFQEQDVETCTYALKWYMQCFLGRLPISLTLRVWDIFLLDGEKILVAMAYNILKMHHSKLST